MREFPFVVESAFDLLEPADKLADGTVEQVFGLETLKPGKVHDRKKQVAQFFLELFPSPAGHGVFQFAQFFLDLGKDLTGLSPIETEAGDFALDFVGFQEGRQAERRLGEDAGSGFFVVFDGFPLVEHGGGAAQFAAAEYMRVATNQFVGD